MAVVELDLADPKLPKDLNDENWYFELIEHLNRVRQLPRLLSGLAESLDEFNPGDVDAIELRKVIDLAKSPRGKEVSRGEAASVDRGITTRNALPLRHECFDDDAENIVAAVSGASARERPWDRRTLWWKIAYATGGMMAAAALILIAALVHFWMLSRPMSASIGAPVTVLMLIASLLVGACVGLTYEAWKRRLR
jgi:hypothetical protein